MIFVTIGTQLAFPRLMAEMDRLAPDLGEEVIAQVGPDQEERAHLEARAHFSPAEFEATFRAARVVVSHAGIGSVLSAKRFQKPLILVPRRFALGEHRSDHQVATARALEGRPGLYVAWQVEALEALVRAPDLRPASEASGPDLPQLVDYVGRFLAS